MGPKPLLEEALRGYTVLAAGSTLIVNVQGSRCAPRATTRLRCRAHAPRSFQVDVLETRPTSIVSLLGDVDLEVDFAPPLVRAPPPARLPARTLLAPRV